MYNDAREVDNKKTASVVVCSRTLNEISSTVQEIKKVSYNCKVLGIKCDVSIPSQVNSLVKLTAEKLGSKNIDILVNNAGVAFNRKLIDTSEEEGDQRFNTNMKGAFSFYKGYPALYDFKKVWSHIKCEFWCWQERL